MSLPHGSPFPFTSSDTDQSGGEKVSHTPLIPEFLEQIFKVASTRYRQRNLLERFKEDLINVAPDPILTWLERLDNRVVRRVKMLGGVLVLGRVTAAHMSTNAAEAQMHPGIAYLQALFAALPAWRHVADLIQMRTGLRHRVLLSCDRFRFLRWGISS